MLEEFGDLSLPRSLREAADEIPDATVADSPLMAGRDADLAGDLSEDAAYWREVAESYRTDYTELRREHEMLGYTVLDAGIDTSIRGVIQTMDDRRKWAERARLAWQIDPLFGRGCDLLNDFTFGRGVSPPRMRDDELQEVMDEAWSDPDNRAVLTTYEAQMALGTALSLQSNLFPLFFEEETNDGKATDHKVKLGILRHDRVRDAITDPQNEIRALWYVADYAPPKLWDFDNDKWIEQTDAERFSRGGTMLGQQKTVYYEHFSNYRDSKEEGRKPGQEDLPTPPTGKVGRGRVYHIRINRPDPEAVFGVPTVQRILKWAGAYNEFMRTRLDIARAAAAYIARTQVKGTPGQVAKLAQQAISRRAPIAASRGLETLEGGAGVAKVPPAPGSVLVENENVTTQPFTLNSGATQAAQDAGMLLGQASAGIGLPKHYLGGDTDSALAMAAAMELPVRKLVESRQELFEQLFRAFIERVIERATDSGKVGAKRAKTDDERRELAAAAERRAQADPDNARTILEAANAEQEQEVERDLSYEFSMPQPIQRVMSDLVGAVANVARTFDPNNTNLELSKVLLAIVLADAFEQQDPADIVDRVYPPGYVDPAVQAAQAQQGIGPDGMPINNGQGAAEPGGFTGASFPPPGMGNGSGPGGGPGGEGNPYSTKQQGTTGEQVQAAAIDPDVDSWLALAEVALRQHAAEQARAQRSHRRNPRVNGRGRVPFLWGSDIAPTRVRVNTNAADDTFEQDVMDVADAVLTKLEPGAR